ncbi:unnamed protein product [Owenia fusiformis]|uniref:Uncharacterized protein n=1 Tax=Owenia fusiformis TaxID=6347 RepID=A0A8S4N1F1_OWEFU|nr:unnamed protein product [Owenia fusiformis]
MIESMKILLSTLIVFMAIQDSQAVKRKNLAERFNIEAYDITSNLTEIQKEKILNCTASFEVLLCETPSAWCFYHARTIGIWPRCCIPFNETISPTITQKCRKAVSVLLNK